ncbi:Shikimate 5-dehydrogenase I alpha [hydrothermal vent metagenome]|uniref:shikimate dehydrogenase (NADP(+)) n=1 Tax=hydrothermal vent metagenome TaxID=652676 RepID=A0A3B0UW91_9ZZZZ
MTVRISGTTKLCSIFGDPVEQTLSPQMHNAAFKALSLDMLYVPFHVTPGGLPAAINAIKAMGIVGVNITIPHKQSVMELIDEVDEQARLIGSVNTIVNRDGLLTGYNTDGQGYLASLTGETGFDVHDNSVVILGAGGTARSIAYNLLKASASRVLIANRTVEKAEALRNDLRSIFPQAHIDASGLNIAPELSQADLLINTTSLGMMGKGGAHAPVDLTTLPPAAIVSDIVFKPLHTPLLIDAEARGHMIHTGLGMLVCQGALGFELWTGREAPIDIMHKAAADALEDD